MKALLTAVALASAVTGCSDSQAGDEQEDALPLEGACTSWTESAPPVDADAAVSAIGGLFDVAGTLEPDRWVRKPDIRLVVVAEVQDFIQGATFLGSFNPDAKTVIMRVRIKQVAKGEAPSGLVHVHLGIAGAADEANDAIKPGTLVALYLETFANRPRLRRDVAMPADAILWGVSPLGFVAANGPDSGVILPYLGEASRTKPFESQLPSSIRSQPRC